MTVSLTVRRDSAALAAVRKQIRRGAPVDPDRQIDAIAAGLADCDRLLALAHELTSLTPGATRRPPGWDQPAQGRPG